MAIQGGPGSYSPAARIRFEAIGEAWNLFKADTGVWLVAGLVAVAVLGAVLVSVSIFFNLLAGTALNPLLPPGVKVVDIAQFFALFATATIYNVVMSLVGEAVAIIVTAGLYRMALRRMRGERIHAGDLFDIGDVFPQLLLLSIAAGAIVTVGLFLCVVPGIIAGALLMFAVPLVMDRRMDAMAAIGTSVRTLGTDFLNAVIFYILLSLILFAGLLVCCVGIIVTLPLFYLAISIVYRDFFPDQIVQGPQAPLH